MEFKTSGDIQIATSANGVLIIKTAQAVATVTVYSPTIIRVNITKKTGEADASFAVIREPLGKLDYEDNKTELIVKTEALSLRINKTPLTFAFYTADGKLLNGDDPRFATNWLGDRVVNHRTVQAEEKFIGLGEKQGNLNRRGSSYVNWNTDASDHTITTDPLYKTIPFYIGLHSGLTYGLFFDNPQRSFFDFAASTDHQFMWFGADGGDMNYYFFGAQSVAGIIEDYTWLTGRMEMPPLWSLGYQQCRWSYMSAKEVLDIAKKFRKNKIPADVMYCDIDYMDDFKIFTWNKKTFKDPKQFIYKLKEMNFKLVTIVDPGIKIEKGYEQYDEGVEKGYFATYPNGENYTGEVWPGRCHFPDFFREDVREWWGAAFKALTEPGVEGFWNDMNEPAAWNQNIPWIVKFGDKFMPEVRNAYGMQMARGTYDGTKKILGNKRPFILTRAAYSGTQRYSAVWTGDNSANDGQLLFGQRLVNSLGLVGLSFVGVDIGGFNGDPTPELMVRWNSLGVYTPMFRNHAIKDSKMREPWEWGTANQAIMKKDIELRYQLLPYIYSGFYQSSQTGLPLSRTLAIDYTHDEAVYYVDYQNQFLFGDGLLVAPVISTEMTAKVYLPCGDWYRFGSDEKYEGGQEYTVDAPLDNLPVFAKAGAIIPMQNIVQSTSENGDGTLELHLWNSTETSSFVYYEDDGNTYDNEKDIYYKRTITFDPAAKTLTLGEVEGSFRSRFDELHVVMHGFDHLAKVSSLNLVNKAMKIVL